MLVKQTWTTKLGGLGLVDWGWTCETPSLIHDEWENQSMDEKDITDGSSTSDDLPDPQETVATGRLLGPVHAGVPAQDARDTEAVLMYVREAVDWGGEIVRRTVNAQEATGS